MLTPLQQRKRRERLHEEKAKVTALLGALHTGKVRINENIGHSPLPEIQKIRNQFREQYEIKFSGFGRARKVLGSVVPDPHKDLLK